MNVIGAQTQRSSECTTQPLCALHYWILHILIHNKSTHPGDVVVRCRREGHAPLHRNVHTQPVSFPRLHRVLRRRAGIHHKPYPSPPCYRRKRTAQPWCVSAEGRRGASFSKSPPARPAHAAMAHQRRIHIETCSMLLTATTEPSNHTTLRGFSSCKQKSQ